MDFDLSELDAIDEGEFIAHQSATTQWVWKYAGPGHSRSVEAAKRRTARFAKENAAKEQAQVNGRKWKAEEKTYDEIREENITLATERLLDWYLRDIGTGKRLDEPVKLNGQPMPFSEEMAKGFLRDPRRAALMNSALEWLGDERSFSRRAQTTSGNTLSAPSSSEETKRDELGGTGWNPA